MAFSCMSMDTPLQSSAVFLYMLEETMVTDSSTGRESSTVNQKGFGGHARSTQYSSGKSSCHP